MSHRATKPAWRRRAGNVAYGIGLAVLALVVAGIAVRVNGQQARLAASDDAVRALAEQVRDLGGTPTVSPPPTPAPGPRGLAGLRGLQGEKGDPGRDGRPPSAGELLTAATRALAADPPPPGEDGTNGADGEDGEDGEKGEPGQDGEDGEDGARGEKGAKGDPGPTCPAGWHQEQVTVLTDAGPRETTTCVQDDGSAP
ncbi:MAG: hypothetical protein ACRDT8_00285 [Micromonosporaceae bacterium]